MNSVPGGFVSQAQPSGYGATKASGPDVSGRFSGHDVVASQSCHLCAAPPPSYSEAMRQTSQAIPDRNNVLLLNNVMRQMREDALQIERRANNKGCCEQLMGNGCLGDLLQTCCVTACMLTLSCLGG